MAATRRWSRAKYWLLGGTGRVGGTGWVEHGVDGTGWVWVARGGRYTATHRSMRVRRGCVYFTIKNYRTHLCALALSCVRNV